MTNHLNQFLEKLKLQELDHNQNLFFVQKKLGVKPSSLLVAIIIFVIIVVLTSNASNLVIGLICCIIPAYFSFVALESDQEDIYIKYLTYWIIFCLIETVSPLFSFILPSLIYVLLRVGITVALLHPSLDYTTMLYRDYIQPYIVNLQSKAMTDINEGRKSVQQQYKRFSRK